MPTICLVGMGTLQHVEGRLVREAAERAEGGIPLFPARHGEAYGRVPGSELGSPHPVGVRKCRQGGIKEGPVNQRGGLFGEVAAFNPIRNGRSGTEMVQQ